MGSEERASETSVLLISPPADAASGRGSGLGDRMARMPFPLYSFRREQAARCIQRLWRMPSDLDALFSSYSTRVQALELQWDEWLYEQNMMRLAHCYRGGARSGASGRYSRLQASLPGGTSRPRHGVARSHALIATGSPEAAHELDRVLLAPSTSSTTSTFSTAERAHDELSRVLSSVPTVGSVLAHTIPKGHSGMCSYSSHYGPSHDAVRSFISSDPSGVFDVSTYWDDESTESIVAASRDPALKRWSDEVRYRRLVSSAHMLWCRPWLVAHTCLVRWALQRMLDGWACPAHRPWGAAAAGNSMLQFFRGPSLPMPMRVWWRLGWCQPARPLLRVRRRRARWRALRAEVGRATRLRAQALAEPGRREAMRMLDSALSAEEAMGGRASRA